MKNEFCFRSARKPRKNEAHRMGPSGTVLALTHEQVIEVHLASYFRRAKGIMKIARLKIIGAAVISVALVTMIFLVSGAAQTETKFTDAATYYRDGKCVVCHGQKAEKKFDGDKKEEDLVETILKGKKPEKPPYMPSFEAKGITADQAKAMVTYMKSLKQ